MNSVCMNILFEVPFYGQPHHNHPQKLLHYTDHLVIQFPPPPTSSMFRYCKLIIGHGAKVICECHIHQIMSLIHCLWRTWLCLKKIGNNESEWTRNIEQNNSFTIIYPITMRVTGAPQTTSQPVSSIFLSSPLPFGTWQTPGPDVVFQPLLLSALSSPPPPPFTVPCKIVFARPDE